ncbi:hypothetical protein BLOT_000683 [Blomia tropicalis]|nr:hypothetical protein BLOT_000683 [Blomia tropicalis]
MVQIKLPVRAYKRLIYITFVSSFLCFLALHLAISYQRVNVPLELTIDGSHSTIGTGQSFRGLLQKTLTLDIPPSPIVSTLDASLSPSSASSASALASSSSSSSSSTNGLNANTSEQNRSGKINELGSADWPQPPPPPPPLPPSPLPSIPSSSQTNSINHMKSSDLTDHSIDDISHYFDYKPHVDESPSLNEAQQLSELEDSALNLALNYWQKARKYPKAKPSSSTNNNSKSCRVDFPSLYELEYNNIYWQKFTTANSSFYLYGAYYDDRWRGGPLPMVRILAMIDRISPPPTLCQIWFDRISVPIISQATYIYGWYNKWGNYHDGFLQPYIVTCKIPRIKGLPKDFYPTSKQEFAVCVKGLDFLHEDLSVRLVEWIELLRLQGANKIFLYELEIHPNISKVLNHYQRDGIVELTKITLPGNQPNLPGFRHLYLKNKLTNKRQNELIPYNDCLYRNLYRFDYVALLDIDEVIMPLQHANWSDLMREVQRISLRDKNYTRASYNVRNVYFLDDLGLGEEQISHMAHESGIPRYLHMLQHVYRSQNYTKPGQYVKCFHNTERAVSLHNHFPLNCFGTCTTYSIPVELAHLQHYRKDCVGPLKKSCKEFRSYTTRDTTIFKYKEPLIERTTNVLRKLGFFDSDQHHS